MAVDKNGKSLPKGITYRADGRYMARLEYQGEKYTLYDRDLKALKKKISDLKYEVEHGLYAKEDNITISSWFRVWMKEYKENSIKAGTIQTYNQIFNNMIEPVLGKKKLKDIRPEMIQKLINDLYNAGYCKARVNIPYILLLGMYRQAMKNGLVMSNPVEYITFPKFKDKKEKRVLSVVEQKLFLEQSQESIYYDFYMIALCTGMRCGEILGLQWNDIDIKNKPIKVRGTLIYMRDGKGRYKDTPKTSCSSRDIPMLDKAEEILKARRKQQLEDKILLGDKWVSEPGLDNMVFTLQNGSVMWDTGVRKDITKIINRIRQEGRDFENITPHTFRHTFATRGLENGIQPKVMQTILGHSSLAMTMDLYSHVLPNTKAEEMQKLANMF